MSESNLLDRQLGVLIDAIELAKEEDTIRWALKTFARTSRFRHYTFAGFHGAEVLSLSSLPQEWQNLYIDRGYRTVDPILESARRHMKPFSWSLPERDFRDPKRRSFLREAKKFGIGSGFTMPISTAFGQLAMLTIAGADEATKSVAVQDVTRAATAVAFVHASLLRISHPLQCEEVRLSSREMTCLTWASLGKTNSETAQMIGIAENTVRFYLVQARDKLSAKNVAHAVRLAIKRGFI